MTDLNKTRGWKRRILRKAIMEQADGHEITDEDLNETARELHVQT